MVECLLRMRDVLGSTPSISTFFVQNNYNSRIPPAKAELVLLCKRMLFSWGCSSVVERLLRMREVLGSTPSISTFCKIIITLGFPPAKAELVLLCKRMLFSWGCSSVVECLLCMREVLGSTPSISTFCKIILVQVFFHCEQKQS